MLNDRLIKWFSRITTDRGTNAVSVLSTTLATDVGLVRKENQDRVAAMRVNTVTAAKPFVVVALVDGMGGMWNGAECATRALSAFFNALIRFRSKTPKERLELAANIANLAVYEFSRGRGGATISAFLVSCDQDTYALNVGDSRIYATIAKRDGEEEVVRLTVDDSLEEAVGGYGKELIQFVGMGDGLVPHISMVSRNANRILVASDGIHFVNQESLSDVLLHALEPKQVAEQLIALARWRGAPDNASLAITVLPELTQSLFVTEETGVEIWDPFSALHVMWLKQEQADFPVRAESPKLTSSDILSTKKVNSPIETLARSKSTKNAKKAKPQKLINKAAAIITNAPQLVFEINSEDNQDKEHDIK